MQKFAVRKEIKRSKEKNITRKSMPDKHVKMAIKIWQTHVHLNAAANPWPGQHQCLRPLH